MCELQEHAWQHSTFVPGEPFAERGVLHGRPVRKASVRSGRSDRGEGLVFHSLDARQSLNAGSQDLSLSPLAWKESFLLSDLFDSHDR